MFMQGRAAALLWRSTAIFLKRTATALGLMEASLLLFNGSKTQGKHNVVLTYGTAAAIYTAKCYKGNNHDVRGFTSCFSTLH